MERTSRVMLVEEASPAFRRGQKVNEMDPLTEQRKGDWEEWK